RSNGSSSTDTVLTMHAPNQDLTSFPTRRSSDLGITILGLALIRLMWRWANPTPPLPDTLRPYERALARFTHAALYFLLFAMPLRSEEHTSELQSPYDLVCRLLLEKKKIQE